MTVTNFLHDEVVDFASYSTIRAIASLIDGQKNSGRKVVHTIQKRADKDTKVSILAGIIAIETEYLHGDISGSVVTMAKNYPGSNNIPLLTREGNFGTRFEPEASANRYIFTAQEKIFDKLFNKEDNAVLIQQEFEGTNIEPRFFVPTLPLILINGSEGIATGFAQKVLPRNPEVIKEYIKVYLRNEEAYANDVPIFETPALTPWYNGFNGIIENGEKNNQYIIKGTFERTSGTRLTITELPIGYNLTSYTKVLDDLEDKKVIRSYTDLSVEDTFKFEIVMDSKSLKNDDEWVLNRLKLTKSVTENFTVMDENNRVVVYDCPEKVINHYIRVKLEYLEKRKQYLIQKTKEDLLILASKYLFIKGVTDGEIIINKKKKQEIVSQIEPIQKIIIVEGDYNYLLNMPIYSLTEEKMEDLLTKIRVSNTALKEIQDEEITTTWDTEIKAV